MGCSKSSSKREVYSNTILPQEQETSQVNNLTLHLKQLEKEEQKNSNVSERKEIIKIRSEINKKEMKEMIAKINKTKSWFFEINKIDKPLARLIQKNPKKVGEKTQINRIRNELQGKKRKKDKHMEAKQYVTK